MDWNYIQMTLNSRPAVPSETMSTHNFFEKASLLRFALKEKLILIISIGITQEIVCYLIKSEFLLKSREKERKMIWNFLKEVGFDHDGLEGVCLDLE